MSPTWNACAKRERGRVGTKVRFQNCEVSHIDRAIGIEVAIGNRSAGVGRRHGHSSAAGEVQGDLHVLDWRVRPEVSKIEGAGDSN